MLQIAAVLCVLVSTLHSYLGERYILIRLFRRDNLPHLFGSDSFTRNTLRFAWHITTIMGWGFGFLLWHIGIDQDISTSTVLMTIGVVFLLSGILAFGFTRGQHLSWIAFWSVAMLAFYVALSI